MTPGHSRLLINDIVLRDTRARWQTTVKDWAMMTLHAAQERTEADFRVLLAGAGLKITGIWADTSGHGSVIEAVRDDE